MTTQTKNTVNNPPSMLVEPRPGRGNQWRGRHNYAVATLKNPESAIMDMLYGWSEYATKHRTRYESIIGDDYVLGPAWQSIGENLRTLLNGELGGLDGGTVDGYIIGTMEYHGIDTSEL